MKDCLKHVPRLIFRVGDAGDGSPDLKGVYDCSKDRVFRGGGAVGNVFEQLRGLPINSVVVRNVDSIACRRRGEMAQWLTSLSDRPCELRVVAFGW